jgi:hypothetical protein
MHAGRSGFAWEVRICSGGQGGQGGQGLLGRLGRSGFKMVAASLAVSTLPFFMAVWHICQMNSAASSQQSSMYGCLHGVLAMWVWAGSVVLINRVSVHA